MKAPAAYTLRTRRAWSYAVASSRDHANHMAASGTPTRSPLLAATSVKSAWIIRMALVTTESPKVAKVTRAKVADKGTRAAKL